MSALVGGAVGLMLAGPFGALGGLVIPLAIRRLRSRPDPDPPARLVLLLLLVEIRSGLSVLAALQRVSRALPDYGDLRRVARVATVSGLTVSMAYAGPSLRPIVAQLARSQHSGGALASTIRRLMEEDLARERARRLARARSLPVRLMIPLTLLVLPGLVLLLYAPSLIQLFDDLTGAWP